MEVISICEYWSLPQPSAVRMSPERPLGIVPTTCWFEMAKAPSLTPCPIRTRRSPSASVQVVRGRGPRSGLRHHRERHSYEGDEHEEPQGDCAALLRLSGRRGPGPWTVRCAYLSSGERMAHRDGIVNSLGPPMA